MKLLKLLENVKNENERKEIEYQLFDLIINKLENLERKVEDLSSYYEQVNKSFDKNLPKCFGSYSDFFCKEKKCKIKKECITTTMIN